MIFYLLFYLFIIIIILNFSMVFFCLFQVLYSYGIGFLYILVGLSIMGDVVQAFQFCRNVSFYCYTFL